MVKLRGFLNYDPEYPLTQYIFVSAFRKYFIAVLKTSLMKIKVPNNNGYGVMSRRQHPISETTNQEHTSRGRHKVFNKVENPHHAASPKWPRQNNQVDKSADTKLYLNIRYGI